ncbi:MAG TPA: tetratricopeptide repeat protein [Polyangia bacterium]|nr:tetratricopeptide repeat protein [Polyangia bacterium]
MPTVREYETALQRNPADTEAFVALRKAYRQAQKHDKLVTLYEARAQAIEDGPKAAELFYLAAELRIDQLGDGEGAEVDLANAVDRDASHIRAAARLKDIYREQGRTADYMTMLEMEAAAVARTRDPARIAELQSEMGQLFVNHFAKLERNVRNAQRPGKLNADNVKSIESARKIYRALGDYRAVVRLYELELEGTTDAKRRADLLLGLGRVLAEKLEELDAAAQRLGEVIRLRPRDEKALDLLAAIYANPNWIGADGMEKAAAIFFQLARRRQEAGDPDNAVAALRRALQAVPGHPESSELLERVYYDGRRYQELDRYYRERIAAATSEPERIDFLYKRAQLAEGEMNDPAEAQRVYGEITTMEPPNGPAAARLVELFMASHDFAKLAELRERQLGAIDDPGERVRIMTELAALYRDRLGDRDQSAVYLHAILQLDPENPTALGAYADHFRDKADWAALADLLEFSFERARGRGGATEEQVRRLEEIAVVSEKNLGDNERALHAWRRIEELTPSYARAREAQRRLLLKGKSWDRMAELLEREAALQEDPAQRAETLRRVAQIHREKLGAPAKAVEIYRNILRAEPHDAVALRALVEIFEREGDFAGLARVLREQIEVITAKQERVSLLRRLVMLYDEKLTDLPQATWAALEILQSVPGDRDTLARLEAILERSGDTGQLVNVLEQHTRYAANPDEKLALLRRISELQQSKLNDLPGAAARWEEVARLDPDDAKALDALTAIYTTLERHADLARVLDMQVDRAVADPMEQAAYLRRLAALAEGPLHDIRRAQRCWENICEILPADTDALDALSRIYTGEGDWATLVRILEKQIPLARDPVRAVDMALLRAQIYDERLRNPEEAARALEQLIAELNPRSWEAHERLRAIYEKTQNWARVVKVAERQLFLIEDPAQRTPRALEVAQILRDRLRDPKKATAAFERVLEIDPDNPDALRALAPLYQASENFERLIVVQEKLLDLTEDPAARRPLILEIARLCEDELAEPRLAFEWYKRAYNENPDTESLQLVDRVAEKHGLYEDLIQIYDGARARAAEPFEQLAAALKIALICEEKLDDPGRAFAILRDTLHADPAGRELLPNLERLAERTKDWVGLLDVYARVARARPETAERVELLRLRAGVRERHLDDPSGAMDEYLRSFALAPENPTTQEEILRVARITSRWEDAFKVQGQLFAMAEDHTAKLAVARNAAYLVEHEVKDPIRAFRAYLNAFRLAPDDAEITGHLWRLAALIGRYEPAPAISDKVARQLDALDDDTEIAEVTDGEGVQSLAEDEQGAFESDADADADAAEDEDGQTEIASAPPVELGEGEGEDGGPSGHDVKEDEGEDDEEDDGENVDLADVVEDEAALAVEEIGDEEILDEIEASPLEGAAPPSLPPPSPGGARRVPGFGAQFETPWEELAQAYESLPADDQKTRHAYLLKIAEVWERGQHDVSRALGALDRAFNLDPSDITVRAELQRIGREYNEWDRVSDIYLSAVDEFGPIENAVALHHEVARFRDELGQIDKSEQLYNTILGLKSDDATALDRIEQIYRGQERWGDLSNLLERRTSGPAESLPHGPERRAKFRELAELYEARLEKPYEAIDTLERFVTETAAEEDRNHGEGEGADEEDRAASTVERVTAYEALVRLYSRVGLWANVVESLQHQADLSQDRAKVRELRLRIATVYEKELGLTERAVEAYEALLAQIPDDPQALAALDRLHEAHGHYEDLQVILGRRAAGASGDERREIVRRRARILEERLGNPEAAASCLRELGTEAVNDDEMMAALIRNLRRAGLAHEAARVLTQKIEMERAAGNGEATRARVSDLSLQLSLLKLDDLNDPRGARAEVETALAAAPNNPAALAAMARLYLKENDFAGYAEARIREAKALAGKPEAVAALLDAGRVFREQIGAPEKAQICFEEALKEDPRNADALRSLAALLASQGAWEEAKTVLLRQLETADAPETRAAVLTDLGRAAWEGSADAAAAQRYLDEALSLVPDHIPAVIAVADIYYKENLWEQAEKRLSEAVRKLRGQPQQMVRLYQRLAEVHEKLGKLEEAYRQLLEADRMGPGQLVTKLSLGENRFRAGKWREAALHLAGLADHPDAAVYPDEVADALAHGAQSEIKLRRPERAIALYESALRLRNGHLPSLRALADLAMERGEKPQAAIYLRRMAEASSDRNERASLLEQVGDRYLDLGDETQALAAYEEAMKLLTPPSEAQVPLLEKALKLQREAGHDEVATRTSSLLIDLVKDPRERAARRREAALLLARRGDTGEAARLLQQVLDEQPLDEEALAGLCDVWPALGKESELEKLLRKTLPTLPAVADDAAAIDLRAGLWEKLGELQARRDPTGALAAYERVVEIQPARVSARLALSGLYGDRPEFAEAAIGNHRMLIGEDISRSESLRALGNAYARRGLTDRARCCFEVLSLFGAAQAEEIAFLDAHPAPSFKADDPYAGSIDAGERKNYLAPPEATLMGEIFSCLSEGAPGIIGQRIEDLGLAPQDKISPMSDLDIGKIYGQVAKALANKKTALFIRPDAAPTDDQVQIVVQAPPALVIGPHLAESAPHTEVRFQLGRGIELTRPEYILAAGVRPKQFTQLFSSVLKAFHPRHSRRRANASDATEELAAKLKKNVPYKVSKRLVELFQELGSTSWSSVRWRAMVHQTGNRAGLLLCGDLRTAARFVLSERSNGTGPDSSPQELLVLAREHEPFRDLIRFALSDEYFVLREKIGTATASAVAA